MAEAATKTAIVTGGAGGVARALLPMLIGEGYRVALIDMNAIGLGKMPRSMVTTSSRCRAILQNFRR